MATNSARQDTAGQLVLRTLAVTVLLLAASLVALPTSNAGGHVASPLDDGGWHLIAHISDEGGMFDGNTDLHPTASHGTYVADPLPGTPDFQRSFPADAEEILFITGNREIWGIMDHAALRSLIDAKASYFGPNITVERSLAPSPVWSNVLSRPLNVEDPWISIAAGSHSDGVGQGLIVWGENNWGTLNVGHVQLKNNNGGINVYVRGGPAITSLTAPVEPVQAGTDVDISATFTGGSATTTCDVDFGDGASSSLVPTIGECAATHTYALPGVYDVTVTIGDDDFWTDTAVTTVVVYDPSAGFVTGGGWIDSPAGALVSEPTASGRANFGFVSRYKKGASTPSGRTLFRFKAGDLDFSSDSYDWLVIAGDRAQYKGTGSLNGAPGYGFMLTAVDADVDRFRIKITLGDDVVYDNQVDGPDGTVLGGGSVVIHR